MVLHVMCKCISLPGAMTSFLGVITVFLYELNNQNITCQLFSFRSAGSQSLL